MYDTLRSNTGAQKALGLLFGIIFGFFLQKAGVTTYKVIINQLLLTDFTVLKVMMSAVVVGTVGVHFMHGRGMVNLDVRHGSFGATVVGGLIFGAGFALLGYCPGTVAGAVGQGAMDALLGGVLGCCSDHGCTRCGSRRSLHSGRKDLSNTRGCRTCSTWAHGM